MSKPSLSRVIAAGVIGNTLELYDFVIYGYFAGIFSKLFFPTDDPLMGLMMTYGVFATGFIMRPLGAIVLGYVGDRWGRKRALEISILLMLVPTLLTGLLPTYAAVGIAAPICLVVCRMLQGFSVGGELVGSYTFLSEHAPPESRGMVASWSLVGGFAGKMLGALVFLIMSLLVSETALETWAWRVPFMLGLVFGVAGLWVRSRLTETPVFEQQASLKRTRAPVMEAFQDHWKPMLQAIGMTCVHTVGVYLLFIYLPVYLRTQWDVSYTVAMSGTILSLLSAIVVMPMSGAWSDQIGRLPLMRLGSLLLMVVAYPAFNVLAYGSTPVIIMTQICLGLLFGVMHAPMAVLYAELFPTRIRSTASGIAYNVAVMVFGGMTPMVATYILSTTGDPLASAYWLSAAALISCLTMFTMKEPVEVFGAQEAIA